MTRANLGTGEWEPQGIGSRRGAEDVGVGSRKELKAVKGWRTPVSVPVEN